MDPQRSPGPEGHNLNFVLPQYTPCGKNHTYHPEDWPSSGEIVIEKCERQCRFRDCKAWSQTAAALRKHVNKHIQHNSLPLKIVPASSGRTPLKIVAGQDLDASSYDSLESLANVAVQDAQPTEQSDSTDIHSKEDFASKSPIPIFSNPADQNPELQAFFKNAYDEDPQTIRTALSILGYKLSGKVVLGADVDSLARSIVGHVEGNGEQTIRAALSTLGEKITGKREDVRELANRIIAEKEDVRDLANRVIGDGPSTWSSSSSSQESGHSPFNSSLARLTENTHSDQTFGVDPVIHLPNLPNDSGYGTPRTATQASPVPDSHNFSSDGSSDPLQAWSVPFFEAATSTPISERHLTSTPPLLKCRVCQKHVKTKSELKKHDLRHRKPFICKVPGCFWTEGFSNFKDLDQHMRSKHPNAFPDSGTWIGYQCHVPRCKSKEKNWLRLDNFRSHLKRVHSDVVRSENDFDEFIYRGKHGGTVAGNGLDLRPLHVLADSAASVR